MEYYFYVVGGLCFLSACLISVNLFTCIDDYFSHLKILIHKTDRIAASIMQLTDVISKRDTHNSEAFKKELIARVMRDLKTPKSALRKQMVDEIVRMLERENNDP